MLRRGVPAGARPARNARTPFPRLRAIAVRALPLETRASSSSLVEHQRGYLEETRGTEKTSLLLIRMDAKELYTSKIDAYVSFNSVFRSRKPTRRSTKRIQV
jgi:hypothetical protein